MNDELIDALLAYLDEVIDQTERDRKHAEVAATVGYSPARDYHRGAQDALSSTLFRLAETRRGLRARLMLEQRKEQLRAEVQGVASQA